MSENIVAFAQLKQKRKEKDVFDRWIQFYGDQPYEELLDSLVYEHENDFPLRRSADWMDRLRHKALVEVCDSKAQTHFLKSFLQEIQEQSLN